VGAEFFYVDEQIDVKLMVAFRNFANAPKNECVPKGGRIVEQKLAVGLTHIPMSNLYRYQHAPCHCQRLGASGLPVRPLSITDCNQADESADPVEQNV
jgi:hypothetical protein